MALNIADRIVTIVATATVTSMIWIVAGGSLIEMADSDSQEGVTRPAQAVPSPTAAPRVEPGVLEDPVEREPDPSPTATGAPLDRTTARRPGTDETRQLVVPVLNVRRSELTDTWADGTRKNESLHQALDIMAAEGASVIAAAAGTIERIHTSREQGRSLYIRSDDGRTLYYYANLGEYAPGLNEGQKIRRGQRLGSVGKGNDRAGSKAPHLHFSILRTLPRAAWYEPAAPVNPYALLTAKGTPGGS